MRLGSAKAAANELQVSEAAISMHVAQLRKELDDKLFTRTAVGIHAWRSASREPGGRNPWTAGPHDPRGQPGRSRSSASARSGSRRARGPSHPGWLRSRRSAHPPVRLPPRPCHPGANDPLPLRRPYPRGL
ncbi:MAG: helix-turn-helix domain-containing protein [Nocardioidaceae bacterium]